MVLSCALLPRAHADAPRLVATRVSDAPKIDGKLSERAWARSFSAAPFVLLGTGRPATQATTAWVLCDAKSIYVGFDCVEDRPEAIASLIEEPDGPVFIDDCVEFFISPRAKPNAYHHFVVNAAGVMRDEFVQDETWNSSAIAATASTPDGWSLEMSIPIEELGLTSDSGGDWRINLCRAERPHDETSSWAPMQSGFHEPGRFGWLTDVGIDVIPHARRALLADIAEAQDELAPALHRASGARALPAGEQAWRHGVEAEAKLTAARRLATKRAVTLEEMGEAEAERAQARAHLAALRAVLPQMDMSIALRKQGVPTAYAACSESSMARIKVGEPYAGSPAEKFEISLAANEYEGVQVVVAPIEHGLAAVRVGASTMRSASENELAPVSLRRVGHVNVTEPSSRSGAAPGAWPDPLIDNAPVDVDLEEAASWLLTARAPAGTKAGLYVGMLTVDVDNAPSREIPVEVTVWDFELPTQSALRTCFRLLPSYLWRFHDLPPAPGVPVGWEYGVWTGADIEGRDNYYGRGVFESRFDDEVVHSGKRSICILGTVAEPGTHEAPRACYHRVFAIEPNTDYTASVWYRTDSDADGLAQLNIHSHKVFEPLPPAGDWTQARAEFNSGDRNDCRVYLCNYGVGAVWFDDLVVAPADATDANAVDDPSFEEGLSFGTRAELLAAYRENMLEHRVSDANIAAPEIDVADDGSVSIDWTSFDREIEAWLELGLNAFNVHWARVPGGWGTVNATDPEQLRVSAEILRQTQAHLESKGWIDLAYIYCIDEPHADAFGDVKLAFEHVRQHAPKLKRLLTFGYGASRPIRPGRPVYRRLDGYVDIWVPHSDCYEPEFLETRRRAGDEIWEYVCISAQKPHANMWGIDFPGTDPRVVFWQCYAEEITGFLYWATNYWEKDPWLDSLTYEGGNGDGSLVYPGPDGPVDSLRWETVRDGIEDYDYLAQLEMLAREARDEGRCAELREQAARLLDVGDVTRSYTEYTDSPTVITEHRAAVARLIERFRSAL